MNVRNCRKCGKMFNYVMGPFICPVCRDKGEAEFQKVKEYVREHPGATVNEVSDICEVPVSQIHQWLREERLELAEGSAIILQCETCGAPISCGRYCEKCKRDLAMGFKEVTRAAAPKIEDPVINKNRDRDRMRFLNK